MSIDTYDALVEMVELMTHLDTDVFLKRHRTTSQYYRDLIIVMDPHVESVFEALTCALLSLSGMYYGYNDEYIDDTSVPWQKLGTNSDCEDFAIAAVGLYSWLKNPKCTFSVYAKTSLGRTLAEMIPKLYVNVKLATGLVTPSVARPDLDTPAGSVGCHGYVVAKKADTFQQSYPIRWTVIECTALTLSYRKFVHHEPDTLVADVCRSTFKGMIMLGNVDKRLLELPTSCGMATLLALGENGVPLKYKTIATMSDEFTEVAVTTDHVTVGVDISDFIRDTHYHLVPIVSPELDAQYTKDIRGFCIRPPDIDKAIQHIAIPINRRLVGISNMASTPTSGCVMFNADDVNRKFPSHAIPGVRYNLKWCMV